jgi:hypothetical protein
MIKIWMISGAVVAVSVAVMAWSPRPARTSEDLLGKAQSEFAIKARDALIQRRTALAQPAAPAAIDAASGVELPYVVASLGPVAVPTTARSETPVAAVAPEATSLAPISLDVPVVTPKLSAAPTVENTKAVEPPPALLPAALASDSVVEPNAAPSVAPVAALAPEATPVTPMATAVTPHEAAQATHKKRRASNAVAHRYQRDTYGYSTPYNLQSLRAHAPEIAAMVARYM